MDEVGKKIKSENDVSKKEDKPQEIRFEDLPKKVQKQILRKHYFSDVKPVEPREVEEGTVKILQALKTTKKPMTRLELVERTGFCKKKVKRILNRLEGFLVKKTTSYSVTTYKYVGNELLK